MQKTAKIFMNGRSQAVRLPADYRFDCNEVFVRKTKSGDVILSRKPGSWLELFEYLQTLDIPDDFMLERENSVEQGKDLF